MDLIIDPSIIPWSYCGSYLCLATRSGNGGRLTTGNDICLVSHRHSGGLPMFTIRPLMDDSLPSPPFGFPTTASPTTFNGVPSMMTWRSASETVAEATFQDVRTILLRGRSAISFDTQGSLAVDQWRCWLWKVPPKADGARVVEFTCSPNVNLLFIIKQGNVKLENDAPYDFNFKYNNRRLVIAPADGEAEWEISIMERDSEPGDEPSRGHRIPFDQCVHETQIVFEEYAASMCRWGKLTLADRLAAYVMWTSTVRPAGFLTTEAVLMSKLWMNKLWSWDNCINGLALVNFDIERALEQILLPFSRITPEGRLPDSMTMNEILYDFTKPPVYGWTFYKAFELLDPSSSIKKPKFELLSEKRLVEIYSSVSKSTRYWFTHRSTTTSVLPYYSHGNDSGWDNSTAFDDQTVCISPDLAGFLILQCDFLAKLGKHLLAEDSAEWATLRDQTSSALVSELWDDQAQTFAFKDAFDRRTWTTSTLLQFVPLVASPFLPKHIVDICIAKLGPYLTEWGLATERLDSNLYEEDGYWRGPIWAPPTIMLESGIRAAGHTRLANTIATRYIRLCEKNGFAENYDAKTGAGNRDLSYTWAASAYLALRHETEMRKKL